MRGEANGENQRVVDGVRNQRSNKLGGLDVIARRMQRLFEMMRADPSVSVARCRPTSDAKTLLKSRFHSRSNRLSCYWIDSSAAQAACDDRSAAMKQKELKIEEHLAKHEVTALLRAIADAVEHDDHEALARFGSDLHESKKNEMSHKQGGIHLSLRLKIKSGDEEGAPVPEKTAAPMARNENHGPDFNNLKKRMKMDFTVLVASLKGDTLPPAATVNSFLADAELMVSHRGYGDEYYDTFIRDCRALRIAVQRVDANACRDALQDISNRMRECHKRYKK